jgi:periplasmic divalent cation tolerance protein
MIAVVTTCPSRDEAERIAQSLLEHRIAACVHVFPANSSYLWEGQVERADEWMCVVKSPESLSYEIPEILCFRCEGSKEYAEWAEREINTKS